MADKKGGNPNPNTGAGPQAVKGGGDSNICRFNKCRGAVTKYGFCNEHFDQFKFGLLNKHGEPVPDFEKKFDHFLRQKAKSKVA